MITAPIDIAAVLRTFEEEIRTLRVELSAAGIALMNAWYNGADDETYRASRRVDAVLKGEKR